MYSSVRCSKIDVTCEYSKNEQLDIQVYSVHIKDEKYAQKIISKCHYDQFVLDLSAERLVLIYILYNIYQIRHFYQCTIRDKILTSHIYTHNFIERVSG